VSPNDTRMGFQWKRVTRKLVSEKGPILKQNAVKNPGSLEDTYGVQFRSRDAARSEKHFSAVDMLNSRSEGRSEAAAHYEDGI
jgi:hypothetical protein